MTGIGVRYTLLIILILVSFVFPQDKFNFIIFGDAHPLILFNAYEQQLSRKEKEEIPQYSAFVIRTERVTLSDNFSVATELQSGNRIFYVLLDSEGHIKNLEKTGKFLTFRQKEWINDTLIVTQDNSVLLRDPINNVPYRKLNTDERIIRIFRSDRREYVRLLESHVFGWLEATDPAALQPFQKKSLSVNGFSESELTQIKRTIQRTNIQIEDLFKILNKNTGQSRKAPQWRLSVFTKKIECSIDNYTSEFRETGIRLQTEIQHILRKKDSHVSGSADHFTIELSK